MSASRGIAHIPEASSPRPGWVSPPLRGCPASLDSTARWHSSAPYETLRVLREDTMTSHRIALLVALLTAATVARPETRRIVFTGAGAEQTFALKELDPNLPTDWSPYQFLVLELRLSSP